MVKPLERIEEQGTRWYVAWLRNSVFRDFKSSGRCTFMVKPTDVIPKDHMDCSLCVKAEGFQEVFNFHRSHKRTFLQPNSIAFPGINALEGLSHSPGQRM